MRRRELNIFGMALAGVMVIVFFAPNVLSYNFSLRGGRTTAHVVLNLEKDAGLPVSRANYKFLDSVIDEAVREVLISLLPALNMKHHDESQDVEALSIAGRVLTRHEARRAFMVIDSVLTRNNIIHGVRYSLQESLDGIVLDRELRDAISEVGPGMEEQNYPAHVRRFIDENMEKIQHIRSHMHERFHLLNCEYMSILYKSVFEALGQGLSIMKAPGHSFVRWDGDGVYLDWETTSSLIYTDEEYMANFGISAEEVAKGVFMSPLDGRAALAIEYLYLGNRQITRARTESHTLSRKDIKRQYSSAIDYYTKSIDANVSYATAYNNRAMAYYEYSYYVRSTVFGDEYMTLKQKALADIQKAVYLYPSDEFKANLALISSTLMSGAQLRN